MNIEGKPHGRLELKRCYLPGVVLSDECPSCGKTKTVDLEENYLLLPPMNEAFTFTFYCGDCDEADRRPCEWQHKLVLNISVSLG